MRGASATTRRVDYVLKRRRQCLGELELNNKYERWLQLVYEHMLPEDSDLTGLFVVGCEDQTAFLMPASGEAAIFFDLFQAATLKSAFAALYSSDPELAVFQLFQSSATLKVSPGHRFLADKLGDAWTGPYDGPGIVDPELLEAARGTLFKFVHSDLQDLFNVLVDSTIIAHEVYHHRVTRSQNDPVLEQMIDEHYEEFVQSVTDDTRAFPIDGLDDSQKARYARERAAVRAYYLEERAMVSEEIACDLFAFSEAVKTCCAILPNDVSFEEACKVTLGLHSILFNLHLLHHRFIKRADLFSKDSKGMELPGDLSLYSLRRVACGVLSSEWCARGGSFESPASPDDRRAAHAASARFQTLQNNIYLEMVDLVLGPCVPRLNGCFALIERTFPVWREQDAIPTKEPLERMALSGLPFRLDREVVNEMMSGWPEYIRAVARCVGVNRAPS